MVDIVGGYVYCSIIYPSSSFYLLVQVYIFPSDFIMFFTSLRNSANPVLCLLDKLDLKDIYYL